MGHPAVEESPRGDRASRTVRLRMLNIRQANLNDVPVLRTLIQEMADYERLPLLITKETLARDGFGSRQSSATRGLLLELCSRCWIGTKWRFSFTRRWMPPS